MGSSMNMMTMGLVLRDTSHTRPVPYKQDAAALNENEVGLSSQITACNAPPRSVATSNATIVDYTNRSQNNNGVTLFMSNSCTVRLTDISLLVTTVSLIRIIVHDIC